MDTTTAAATDFLRTAQVLTKLMLDEQSDEVLQLVRENVAAGGSLQLGVHYPPGGITAVHLVLIDPDGAGRVLSELRHSVGLTQ